MKGGFPVVKISWVFFIAVVCTTVLVLAWTKNATINSFLQTQNPFQQVSSGSFSSIGDETSSKDLEEKHSLKPADDAVVVSNSVSPNYPGEGDWNRNVSSTKMRQDDPSSIEEVKGTAEAPKDKISSKEEETALFAPTISVSINSYGKSEQIQDEIIPKENQVCSFTKGKWVMDAKRPLYSGFGCKQWLSSMWACRLTQRIDFEYESLRWQPKDCQMEEFTGRKFLSRMMNKTLAFIGDSLGRQQFQSLMCMITGGEARSDVLDVGIEYGLVKARGAIRPDGWAYRFPSTNTTILYYWSASLCDLVPINASNRLTDIAMHLDRPPAFLRRYIHKFDVLVLNTGHHWNAGKLKANRWIMHVGGIPNMDRRYADINSAKNLTVYSIINWLDSQLPNYPSLKAFFRSISPRHFFNGDWNTGGTCDNTSAPSGGKEVLKDESSDPLAAGATRGNKVKLLDITAVSELRDEGHISRYSLKATPGVQDCLHWCLPGVPDAWNEILFAQL